MTGRSDDLDRWDETLDAEVTAEGLPDGELRAEVLRQRLAHGLLRAAAPAADAAGRERFVHGILAKIDAAEDGLAAVDETLDELEIDGLPDTRIRAELVRQRVVHGLLRTANAREDAAARDRRVERIVAAAGGAEERGGRILQFPGRWLKVAAAATVVIAATVVVWATSGRGGHSAVLEAAAKELGKEVDRRYVLSVEQINVNPRAVMGVHQMWFCPLPDGRFKFRVEVDGERAGRQRIGSDGYVVWRTNLEDPADRDARPCEQANEIFAQLQGPDRSSPHDELDDPDHFDLRKMLERLAGDADVRAQDDVHVGPAGHEVQTFYHDGFEHPDFGRLSSVLVCIDLERNVFDLFEFVRIDDDGDGLFRYRFEYRGDDPRPAGFYDQPW